MMMFSNVFLYYKPEQKRTQHWHGPKNIIIPFWRV